MAYPKIMWHELPKCCRFCKRQESWQRFLTDKPVRMKCAPEIFMVAKMIVRCPNYEPKPNARKPKELLIEGFKLQEPDND